ncbi:hypothetical protein SLUN_08855 [Streptomyces lunaelactis]|uniref:DUF6286 domain-containing protein n=1 Tax=Streptomyces lunaelactis TaxID=1535768 RepID=A0A2R4SZG9_9ACTN|nr:DUF6286 domain-containing protein [Streptomyces lunaelactis]AVZ72285.1 hypothetical protein SLUN_08855 [Streptomyces lunaelactis]NUK87370.1 hypothetical protein [Streptomyces lunaelactis]NUL05178.1 hypothetical protein [Streptomyces lunaelactis]
MSEPAKPAGPVLDLDQSASAAAYEPVPDDGDGGKAGRFWSVRRVPAGLLAVVVLGGTGLLLYDIAAVRADRPAMHWRRTTAAHLEEWRLDETGVLAAAAAAMALGVCLIVIAVTPGLRALLPMRRDVASVRAGLDREAAALVLRDRAMEVSGVQSVRVRMGRAKVSVRAQSHFRELDDVRADLDAALGTGIRELGLARQPALTVYVSRPPAKKA